MKPSFFICQFNWGVCELSVLFVSALQTDCYHCLIKLNEGISRMNESIHQRNPYRAYPPTHPPTSLPPPLTNIPTHQPSSHLCTSVPQSPPNWFGFCLLPPPHTLIRLIRPPNPFGSQTKMCSEEAWTDKTRCQAHSRHHLLQKLCKGWNLCFMMPRRIKS